MAKPILMCLSVFWLVAASLWDIMPHTVSGGLSCASLGLVVVLLYVKIEHAVMLLELAKLRYELAEREGL